MSRPLPSPRLSEAEQRERQAREIAAARRTYEAQVAAFVLGTREG